MQTTVDDMFYADTLLFCRTEASVGLRSRFFGRSQKEEADQTITEFTEADIAAFLIAARESVTALRETLGEDSFTTLRTIDREIPSAGEIILAETHGLTPGTIANNLKQFVKQLDQEINVAIQECSSDNASIVWRFIVRLDDLADIGTFFGDAAERYVHNLLEYHLALINYLHALLSEEAMDKLVKRFASRQALRAKKLFTHSGRYQPT